jgi:hypothetical protein
VPRKLAETLMIRMRAEGIIPRNAFASMYRTGTRREPGEWSWFVSWDGKMCGSESSMADVLSWEKWNISVMENDTAITEKT